MRKRRPLAVAVCCMLISRPGSLSATDKGRETTEEGVATRAIARASAARILIVSVLVMLGEGPPAVQRKVKRVKALRRHAYCVGGLCSDKEQGEA